MNVKLMMQFEKNFWRIFDDVLLRRPSKSDLVSYVALDIHMVYLGQ